MSESAQDAWLRCRPYLEAAIHRFGEGDIEAVTRDIEAGAAWFVPGERAAAVLQMTRDCNIWLAGGDLGEILGRLTQTEAWARERGCDRTTLIGRKGWQRVLGPMGYRPMQILAKDLT